MALATATISYDLSDLLGVDFDARRTKITVSTNVPGDTIVDTASNEIRLGCGKGTVSANGTGSVNVPTPSASTNPASWQTFFTVDYPDRHGRATRVFGPFTITASANLADLVAEQEIPPDFTSSAFIAQVEAIRDEQVDISNISTSDDVVSAMVKGTAGAGPKTRAELSATIVAREGRAPWVAGSSVFRDGFYRCEPHAGAIARDRFTEAITGAGRFHLGVLGDSTTHIAGETDPANAVSWPARLRDQMARTYGLTWGGTGWVWLWDTYGANPVPASPYTEPRLNFVYSGGGSLSQTAGLGLYGHACLAITTNSARTSGYVEFTPEKPVDQMWVVLAGGGTPTRLVITNTANTADKYQIILPAAFGGSASDTGWTSWPLLDGYVRASNPSADGGLRVAGITLPKGSWSMKVMSNDSGSTSYLMAVRGVDSAGRFEVTNAAQAGRSLNDLWANANETSGYGGGPLLDLMQLDLALIAFGLNDWQGHRSVATFGSQLTETIQRQRFTGSTGTAGKGVGASGDAMLIVQPQPDYANHPPDGIQVPGLHEFWSRQYTVADSQGVALVDNAWAWVDYQTSATLFRDFIHPNNKGAADIGLRVARGIAGVLGGA